MKNLNEISTQQRKRRVALCMALLFALADVMSLQGQAWASNVLLNPATGTWTATRSVNEVANSSSNTSQAQVSAGMQFMQAGPLSAVRSQDVTIPAIPAEFKRARTADGKHEIVFTSQRVYGTQYRAFIFDKANGKYEGVGNYYMHPYGNQPPAFHTGSNFRFNTVTKKLEATVSGKQESLTVRPTHFESEANILFDYEVREESNKDVLVVHYRDKSYTVNYPKGSLEKQNLQYIGRTLLVPLKSGSIDMIGNLYEAFQKNHQGLIKHHALHGESIVRLGEAGPTMFEVVVREKSGAVKSYLMSGPDLRKISVYSTHGGLGEIPERIQSEHTKKLMVVRSVEGPVEIHRNKRSGTRNVYIDIYNPQTRLLVASYSTLESGFDGVQQVLGISGRENNEWAVFATDSNKFVIGSLRRQNEQEITLPTTGKVIAAQVISKNVMRVTQQGGKQYDIDLSQHPAVVSPAGFTLPAGWVRSESNDNFAFFEAVLTPPGAAPVRTLRVMNIQKYAAGESGAIQVLSQSAVVPFVSSVRDVSADGKFVIYSVGSSAGNAEVIVRDLNDSSKQIKLKARGSLESITYENYSVYSRRIVLTMSAGEYKVDVTNLILYSDKRQTYHSNGHLATSDYSTYSINGQKIRNGYTVYNTDGKRIRHRVQRWWNNGTNREYEDRYYYPHLNGRTRTRYAKFYNGDGTLRRVIYQRYNENTQILSQSDTQYQKGVRKSYTYFSKDSKGRKTLDVMAAYHSNGRLKTYDVIRYQSNSSIKSYRSSSTYDSSGRRTTYVYETFHTNGQQKSLAATQYVQGKRVRYQVIRRDASGHIQSDLMYTYHSNGRAASYSYKSYRGGKLYRETFLSWDMAGKYRIYRSSYYSIQTGHKTFEYERNYKIRTLYYRWFDSKGKMTREISRKY